MSELIMSSSLRFYNPFTWGYGWIKNISAVVLACLMTIGLFVVMQKLIFVQWVEPVDDTTPILPNIVMPKDNTIIEKHFTDITPIETVEPPSEELHTERENLNITPTFARVEVGKAKIEINIGGGTNDYPIAQYLVNAQYPRTALQRGIEGYVDVRFDVNEQGQTENIQVLSAVPEGVFNSAAIKAVAKWRYQPKLVDGVPKYFSGVSNRVRFQMAAN